jgi:hypothetical protein
MTGERDPKNLIDHLSFADRSEDEQLLPPDQAKKLQLIDSVRTAVQAGRDYEEIAPQLEQIRILSLPENAKERLLVQINDKLRELLDEQGKNISHEVVESLRWMVGQLKYIDFTPGKLNNWRGSRVSRGSSPSDTDEYHKIADELLYYVKNLAKLYFPQNFVRKKVTKRKE